MAVVWLSTDRVLDRHVAVKVLRDPYAADPVVRERFTREALHAARLSHPGVVATFDAGVDEGTAYLVMEVVRGRTLHDVLRSDGPLPVEQAVAIAGDVCGALDAAHRAGIVHRDIKPGNILISDAGRTQVCDFGIARADGSTALTQVSTVIGTPDYLSPEQAAGGAAGPQSDLYAVGCVLAEMLTGSPPFPAETPVSVLYRHINDAPPVPSATRPEIPADVDAVVLHLLAKDPAHRPSGAAEARRELSSVATFRSDTRILPTQTLVAPAVLAGLAPVESPPDPHRTSRISAAALVIAVAVIAFAATTALLSGRTSGASSATGTPSRSESLASAAPSSSTPAASSVPVVAVPVATSAAEAVAVFRSVVLTTQQESLLDAASAAQLLAAADAVASARDRGKGKPAAKRAQELGDLVSRLAVDGRIAPSAVGPLSAAADQVRQQVEAAR
jgi:serine/threonine-protein kinase